MFFLHISGFPDKKDQLKNPNILKAIVTYIFFFKFSARLGKESDITELNLIFFARFRNRQGEKLKASLKTNNNDMRDVSIKLKMVKPYQKKKKKTKRSVFREV